jgi:mycothiol synthase
MGGDLPRVRAHDGIVVRTFRPGADEDAVLEVNAAAFAHHPEQGRMTRADLEAREAEDWFDPAGFFVATTADGTVVGFHWTKVHSATRGEVYVVGISPAMQGSGLGTLLTLTGLHHLADRGLDEVILYVESDNAAAVAVYSKLGFTHADADTDVMYQLRPDLP